MRYDLKPWPELYWAIATALAFVLFTELAGLNPEGVSDWRAWGSALGVACFRAIGGAGLDWVRRNMMQQSEELAETPPVDTEALIAHIREQVKADLEAARLARIRPIEDARRPRPTLVNRPAEWVESAGGKG